MDEILKLLLIYGVAPIVLGTGAYIVRSIMQRIAEIEKSLSFKVDDNQVRQLLVDKIEPLREDVQELKIKLDKIVDLLLKK